VLEVYELEIPRDIAMNAQSAVLLREVKRAFPLHGGRDLEVVSLSALRLSLARNRKFADLNRFLLRIGPALLIVQIAELVPEVVGERPLWELDGNGQRPGIATGRVAARNRSLRAPPRCRTEPNRLK